MFETVYGFFLTLITLVTTILQCYVFYLIKYESPRKIGDYRFFLYMFTAFDLIFTTLLGFFLQPSIISNAAAKIEGLLKYVDVEVSVITVALIFYSGAVIIAYQTMSVIYRYSLLHGNKTFKNILMSNYSKVIFGVIIQILAALIGFFVYRMFLPKESISGYLNFFKNRGFLSADDGDVVDCFKSKEIGDWFAELISAFFVLLILITLKRNIKSLSHRAYKVHKQFALLLAVQVMVPFVFIFFPVVTGIFLMGAGRYVTSDSLDTGFVMLTSYGFFNSFFTLVFISSYRWHFYENFICPWLKFIFMCFGLSDKLPKRRQQEDAPPTSTDQHVPRNKIDVCGAGLHLVECLL
ncbi:hypothetical protein M3Y97_00986900 [Aphelenchoides bicaudatus]|nr:hypothetical protein M3Y97_00986900 [Aphelenchoides bicaudatus]